MRALRRIAGAGWRPNESTPLIADSEVKKRLGAPSIECMLIKVSGQGVQEETQLPDTAGHPGQEVRK